MFRNFTLQFLFSLALAVAVGSQAVHAATPDSDVLFIFDASASMSRKTLKGKRKIDVAKAAFVRMINKLPESGNIKVGLMAYGHRIAAGRPYCCRDIEVVVPVNSMNRKLLSATVRKFRPRGKTPIARSLLLAGATLRKLQTDRQKVVVLLTDGIETCGGDPRQAAAALRKLGLKVDFYVIGFDLPARQVKPIKAIAEAGGGTFLNAKDSDKLQKAFEVVEEAIQNPSKKPAKPKRRATAWFFDDFKGEGLVDHWKVENRDDDAHIVENGALTLVANTPGSVEKGTIPNFLRLNKPLPAGDWTMTIQLRARIQTAKETIVFGLHRDKHNYILAAPTYYTGGYHGVCDVVAVKMTKGKKAELRQRAYDKHSYVNDIERFKSFPQPMLLRLEKRGRGYTVFYGFEVEDKKTKEKLKWTSVGKLTSLRAKGQLVLGFYQREKVAGESSINVDWVRIDRNE